MIRYQIRKYQLEIQPKFILNLTSNWKFMHLDVQHGIPCIWVTEDIIGQDKYPYMFYWFPTGIEIDADNPDLKFLGTVLIDDGNAVFHLYRRILPIMES